MQRDPSETATVRDLGELVAWFQAPQGERAPRRIGIEHEKLAFLARPGPALGAPVPYEGDSSVRALLGRMAEGGFRPLLEGETVIALDAGAEQVTLEPGGQVEHSGPPGRTLAEIADNHRGHLRLAVRAAEEVGLLLGGIGFRPLGTLDDVPWMPKARYVPMREALGRRGRLAHEMMKRTATVQANLDYDDEVDCARKLRTALGVTSIVTALFAASPLHDGKPAGMESVRAAIWLDTDDDRCGLLPFAFAPPEQGGLFERYAEWALDVPMLFLLRHGRYRATDGRTFRRFVREGLAGEQATLGDWEVHLSTLFPEARLKRYLEVRGADCGPEAMVLALPALWCGLLYDRAACDAAWSLVAELDLAEREALRRDVPIAGLEARVRGRTVRALAIELVALAREGLLRQGEAGAITLLDPLVEIAQSGRTASRAILEAFRAAHGEVAPFLEAIRYRVAERD